MTPRRPSLSPVARSPDAPLEGSSAARGGPRAHARARRAGRRRGPRPRPRPADEPAGLGPRPHRRVRGPLAVPRAPAASSRCGPSCGASTTPTRRRGRDRGDLPYLRRDEALEYMAAVRERALERARAATPTALDLGDGRSSTSTSTTRRCCRRCSSPSRASSRRERAAGAGAAAARARVRGRGRAVRAGRRRATASPTTTSARGTSRPARVRDRPRAGDERRLPRVRRGRRLRAARAVVRRGLGVARARGRRAPALLDRRRRRAPLRPRRAARARAAGDARLLVRGRRLRALGGGGCPTEAEWEKRRARARHGATPSDGATSTSSHFGPRAPAGPVRAATPGSGRPASSTATRASAPFPYREYSEVFFGGATGCCAAARGPRARASRATPFRNWDLPQRRQIFAGFRCAEDAR